MDIYATKMHLTILLRILMPTSDINKFFFYKFVCLQMALDNSTMNSLKKMHLTILLRIIMPASHIGKFYYEFICLQTSLENSTINSYSIFLLKTILLRNTIPTIVLRQLYY